MNLFYLKLIAFTAMLLDHIAYFFPAISYAELFHLISRLAAPIFTWGIANGMRHTSDPSKYILRLYIFSVIMAVIQMFTGVELNIMRMLFLSAVLIYLLFIDHKYFRLFCTYQIFVFLLCYLFAVIFNENSFSLFLFPALAGSFFLMEGGIPFIILAVLAWIFFDDKRKFSFSYFIWVVFYTILYINPVSLILYKMQSVIHQFGLYLILRDILDVIKATLLGINTMNTGGTLLSHYDQWMTITALPIIILYNGKKGMNSQRIFYVLYPVHIVILWYIKNF